MGGVVTGGWDYTDVQVLQVVDGDTVDLRLGRDIGFGAAAYVTVRCRLVVVDTPERGKPGWGGAKDFTYWWLHERRDKGLRATTYRHDGTTPDGGFGRWLVDLYTPADGSLSAALLDAGHAVPYRRSP